MGNSPARRARLKEKARLAGIEHRRKLGELRATGAACGNCVQFKRRGMGEGYECLAGAESGGWYQPAKADGLCLDWALKAGMKLVHGA